MSETDKLTQLQAKNWWYFYMVSDSELGNKF